MDERFRPKRVLYPRANPAVKDRFARCNAMLCNAAGERRLFIHKKCTNLITDLTNRAYKEGTTTPDDQGDVSHSSDALGYVIYPRHPLMPTRTGTAKVGILHG